MTAIIGGIDRPDREENHEGTAFERCSRRSQDFSFCICRASGLRLPIPGMQHRHDTFTRDLLESQALCLKDQAANLPEQSQPAPHSSAMTGAERSRRWRQQQKLRQTQTTLF